VRTKKRKKSPPPKNKIKIKIFDNVEERIYEADMKKSANLIVTPI
jgi:hypothetical protein